MQITERQYKSKVAQLKQVKAQLTGVLELQSTAAEAGDLRENEEYATARSEAERLSREKEKLEYEILEAEIVTANNSPCITLGSLIEFCKVDAAGNPLSSPRRVRLEASGNTVLQQILGANSSLGKAVLNGTDGIYTVPDNGGINYNVTKIIEDSL